MKQEKGFDDYLNKVKSAVNVNAEFMFSDKQDAENLSYYLNSQGYAAVIKTYSLFGKVIINLVIVHVQAKAKA